MTGPKRKYRRLNPDDLVAAGLDLIESRGWTTATLRAAGNDPELRRAALAEMVWAAWTTVDARRPISAAQREILRAVRIWTPFQAYCHGAFLDLGARVAGARARYEPPLPQPPKMAADPPEPPAADLRAAARLMSKLHGRPPEPRVDHAANIAAGVAASERAQVAAAFDGLTRNGHRALASLAVVAFRDEPNLSPAQAEVLDWALRQREDAQIGRLMAEVERRGLMDDVFDLAAERLRDEPNTDAQEG